MTEADPATGILGGSFNPPHRGHLALARAVLGLGLVRKVIFIPAAVPPHKTIPCGVEAGTRLAMTRLLVGDDSRLEVNDLELRRSGPSFSIDTVRELNASHPGERFHLIIGSDMARTFASWREAGELLRLAPPLIAQRPDAVLCGGDADMFPGLNAGQCAVMKAGMFRMDPVAINSTLIREMVSRGADDDALLAYLTRPVLDYIRETGLYREKCP